MTSSGSTTDDRASSTTEPATTSSRSGAGDDTSSSSGTGSSEEEGSTGGDPSSTATVIYLNADGVEIAHGGNDSKADEFPFEHFVGVFGPVEDAAFVDDVQAGLEEKFANFDFAFVQDRPASGDYMMIVLSPDWHASSVSAGIAGSTDCGNDSRNDVGIIQTDLDTAAVAINLTASVVGQNLGVEATFNGDDLSALYESEVHREWLDECIEITSPSCVSTHDDWCPDCFQNPYQELLERLGPAPRVLPAPRGSR